MPIQTVIPCVTNQPLVPPKGRFDTMYLSQPSLITIYLLASLIPCLHAQTEQILSSKYAHGPIPVTSTASIYHEANPEQNSIRLALVITDSSAVDTTENWLGLGIGEPTSGSMPGSDIVTAQFVRGASDKCEIVDRYVPFAAYPLGEGNSTSPAVYPNADDCPTPDWTLVSCRRDATAGVMVLEVSRSLSVIDGKQDRAITPGPNAVLHAYGSSFSYHGANRHSSVISFYEDPELPPVDQSIAEFLESDNDVDGHVDIRSTDFIVPTAEATTYACTSVKLPLGDDDRRMIVAAEPLIENPKTSMVHHITLYLCRNERYAEETKDTVVCGGRPPYGPLGNRRARCSTLIYGCKYSCFKTPTISPRSNMYLVNTLTVVFNWPPL